MSLFGVLSHDVSDCVDLIALPNSQTHRRSLVRAFFAYVEGVVFGLKQQALDAALEDPGLFTPAEIAALREEQFIVDHHGRVSTDKKFIKPLPNIRFALESYVRDVEPSFRLDVSDARWDDLGRSLRVRDRITHPKAHADLTVSDDEVESLRRAWEWFKESLLLTVYIANQALEKRHAELEREKALFLAQVRSRQEST
jgi:hypothetical protein